VNPKESISDKIQSLLQVLQDNPKIAKIIEPIKSVHWQSIFLLITTIVISESALFIGKTLMTDKILFWYQYLLKPALTPPNWVFGVVWSILYLLSGIALYLFIRKVHRYSQKNHIAELASESQEQDVPANDEEAPVVVQDGENSFIQNLIDKKTALILFVIQLLLSASWAPVFFGLKSIPGGFAVTVLLWTTLFATFYKFYKTSRIAGILLIPSLLWVSFAIGLNLAFWMLNRF